MLFLFFFNFLSNKCIFRIPEELKEEIRNTRGYKQMLKLWQKYNKEEINKYVNNEIKKLEKKIKELNELKEK